MQFNNCESYLLNQRHLTLFISVKTCILLYCLVWLCMILFVLQFPVWSCIDLYGHVLYGPLRSDVVIIGHGWSFKDLYSSFWSFNVSYGCVMPCAIQNDPSWSCMSCMVLCDYLLSSLGLYVMVWPPMVKYGLLWSHVN